jgi:hypothetical protein
MRAFEAFIGSFGILLAGMFTIPFAAHLSGVQMNLMQGAQMSALFFIGRFIWLYIVRVVFSRIKKE